MVMDIEQPDTPVAAGGGGSVMCKPVLAACAQAPSASAVARTTNPLGARTCGDEHCNQNCTFRQLSAGNTWHCQVHLGAVHVCDMRCRFRTVVSDAAGNFCYRCQISGLWTYKRLIVPESQHKRRSDWDCAEGMHMTEQTQGHGCAIVEMTDAQDNSSAQVAGKGCQRRFVRAVRHRP